MLFADDTYIFYEPNCDQLRNLRCLFLCFETVSILVNNSKIVFIGDMGDVEGLASILGCKVVSLPMMYLGFLWEHLTRILPF
jgi:hypothetical protein